MNPFLKQLVNQKMNRMTPAELVKFGQKYDLNIKSQDASKVMNIIHAKPVDIFQEKERRTMLKEISKKTNPELAKNMEALFKRFLRWADKQNK